MQLIDATQWFKPLRKNLGKKNCELVRRRHRAHLRHLPRLRGDASSRRSSRTPPSATGRSRSSGRCGCAGIEPDRAYTREGDQGAEGDGRARRGRRRRSSARSTSRGKRRADPLHGLFETTIDGKRCVVEYEPDSDLRDTEQVPLLEEGGIEAFIAPRGAAARARRLVSTRPAIKIGYEISFTRYFYKPQPLRTLEEIRADILALERETEGLLGEIGRSGSSMNALAQAVCPSTRVGGLLAREDARTLGARSALGPHRAILEGIRRH